MTAPNKRNGRTLEEYQRMCYSKTRYADEIACRASAQTAIIRSEREGKRDRRKYLFVYKCPACRGYHMTHHIGSETLPYSVSADDLYYDPVERIRKEQAA